MGYFGIGIDGGKTPANLGTLWRSAHAFGADLLFTVGGARYPRDQVTDTTKACRHVPLIDLGAHDLSGVFPRCKIVGVERVLDTSCHLPAFVHPAHAIYVLGAEDRGLSEAVFSVCDAIVEIPSAYCLNVAVAGSIVMYDRVAKAAR